MGNGENSRGEEVTAIGWRGAEAGRGVAVQWVHDVDCRRASQHAR